MGNLNKAKAYKKIVRDYDTAVEMMKSLNLVLGEQAVIPFYATAPTGEIFTTMLVGMGSINGEVEIIYNGKTGYDPDMDRIIWYGSGTTYLDTIYNKIITDTPYHDFRINVDVNDSKLFIIIPKSMPAVNFTMNGFTIPMGTEDVTLGDIEYVVYFSRNTYVAGSYVIKSVSASA